MSSEHTISTLSAYEVRALEAIREWREPSKGWGSKALAVVNRPLEALGAGAGKIPGFEWVLEKSVGGLLNLANDFAHWTVRSDAIHAEYRRAGHEVDGAADLRSLDLEDIDRTIGYIGAKYKSLAALEGAGAGALGLPGIAADIVALITLNLRAIGEYAAYCGFDTSLQQERVYALNVLNLAASPTDTAKVAAMAHLVKVAEQVARKTAWEKLEKHVFVQIVQQLSQALGMRLTKAKLAQVVPVAGAVIGGGFNAYFTAKVCDAAFHLYRERYLLEKGGSLTSAAGADIEVAELLADVQLAEAPEPAPQQLTEA